MMIGIAIGIVIVLLWRGESRAVKEALIYIFTPTKR